MNKIKEIFLTVFTFPRYTLWKIDKEDTSVRFSLNFGGYFSIFMFMLYFLDFPLDLIVFPYAITWFIASEYFIKVKKGD